MPMKKYKPEQIVTLLRQIELEIANGKPTPQACVFRSFPPPHPSGFASLKSPAWSPRVHVIQQAPCNGTSHNVD